MLKIDNTLLDEIGLGALPEVEKNSFLKHVYETLEMRVGIRLADQMSNEQLDEFEQYFEAKDDAGAFKWLESNFPNYKEIVQQEFDKLKAEVAQSAPQILSASQGQASAGVPEGQVVQQPVPAPVPQQQYEAPQPQQQAQPVAPQPAPQPLNEFSQNPQPQAMQQPTAPDPAFQAQPPAQPQYAPPQQPQAPQYDQQPPAGPAAPAPQPIQPPQPVQRQPHQPWQPDQQ